MNMQCAVTYNFHKKVHKIPIDQKESQPWFSWVQFLDLSKETVTPAIDLNQVPEISLDLIVEKK